MNLTNKTIVKDLLKRREIKPEKYLGQHFILSKKALARMVSAAEIEKNDTIIEIGPGLGTLTQELAKIPHPFSKGGGPKIIAIEKDPKMISILKETLAGYKNIKIVQADARNLWVSETHKFGGQKRAGAAFDGHKSAREKIRNQFFDRGEAEKYIEDFQLGIKIAKNKYKIVANLPYNVATFLIRQWLDPPPSPGLRRARPELMVLMIQKEVAQRICAKPRLRQGYGGQAPMNLLAVSIQFYADVKIIDYVQAEAFWPKPKVDSAIIKIVPKRSKRNDCFKPIGLKQSFAFFRIVKAGFSQPRKQLIGNLMKKLKIPREKLIEIFKDLNISEQVRAENLSLEQWVSLAISLQPNPQRK